MILIFWANDNWCESAIVLATPCDQDACRFYRKSARQSLLTDLTWMRSVANPRTGPLSSKILRALHLNLAVSTIRSCIGRPYLITLARLPNNQQSRREICSQRQMSIDCGPGAACSAKYDMSAPDGLEGDRAQNPCSTSCRKCCCGRHSLRNILHVAEAVSRGSAAADPAEDPVVKVEASHQMN